MIKIGLLSDTHAFLDDAVFKYFDTCDEIWHVGDFGSMRVIEELEAFKPLRGVYGNIDDAEIRRRFPEHLRFNAENVDVWMTHIGGYPGRYSPLVKNAIQKSPPKLFISGHSHILKVQFDPKLQLLHLNPGAAGKQGWHKVRTLMRFTIQDDRVEGMEVIELGDRS